MTQKRRRSIMVAIADTDRSAMPLLKKAAAIAASRGLALHVLHVMALPYAPASRVGVSARAAVKESVREAEHSLQTLLATLRMPPSKLRASVVWDYPAADAIVRQVMKHRPAMLIAASKQHSRVGRLMLSNADWELIRHCPCPLLLSKTPRSALRPVVLAAVDPFHAHAKPARLDASIVEAAIDAAGSTARVFICHARAEPWSLTGVGTYELYWENASTEQLREIETKNRRMVEIIADRAEVPRANVLYLRGDAAREVPRAAKRVRADLVVIGAVSRSAVKRLFIGNTAERLLDQLDTDVLIVKPKRFTTDVPRRTQVPLMYPPYSIL